MSTLCCSALPPGVDSVYVEIFDEVCLRAAVLCNRFAAVEQFSVLLVIGPVARGEFVLTERESAVC